MHHIRTEIGFWFWAVSTGFVIGCGTDSAQPPSTPPANPATSNQEIPSAADSSQRSPQPRDTEPIAPEEPPAASSSQNLEKDPLAWIESWGGLYRHEGSDPNQPLRVLLLNRSTICDEETQHLKGWTELKILDLASTSISDDGLPPLSKLVNLQSLNLGKTNITDEGLVHLTELSQLQGLSLSGTGVSEAGLEHLSQLTQLTPNGMLTKTAL